jgi:hypothetical protein
MSIRTARSNRRLRHRKGNIHIIQLKNRLIPRPLCRRSKEL